MKTALALLVGLTVVGTALAQTDFIDRAVADVAVERQRTIAIVNERIEEARQLIAAERFTQADIVLRNAERVVNTSVAVPAEERQALINQINRLGAEVSTAHMAAQAERQQRARLEIEEQHRQRVRSEELLRQRQLESQWARLRDYESVNDYARAAATADSILRMDPTNKQARRTGDRLEFFAEQQNQLNIRTDRMTYSKAALVDVEGSAVPLDGLRYPANWHNLTAQRRATVARETRVQSAPEPARRHLGTRLSVSMEGVTLDNVISYLSESTQVPIVFDPRIAEDTGRDPRQEVVTLNARNLTLQQALDMVLPSEYGFRAQNESLIISSREKAYPLRVIIYPIRHLVAEIPDFGSSVPKFNIVGGLEGGSGATAGDRKSVV